MLNDNDLYAALMKQQKKKPTPQEVIDALMNSGLADTLSVLSGGGKPKFGMYTPAETKAVHQSMAKNFIPTGNDSIAFHPDYTDAAWISKQPEQDRMSASVGDGGVLSPGFMKLFDNPRAGDLENTFSHEMGHRAQTKRTLPDYMTPAFESLYKSAKPGTLPGEATSPSELQATAFASGIDYLRGMKNPNDKEKSLGDLAEMDKKVPGTSMMVSYLLQQPIYANHPAKAFFK